MKVQNATIELFLNPQLSPSLHKLKLISGKKVTAQTKMNVFRLFEKMTGSEESRAYQKLKEETIEKHGENGQMQMTHPEMVALLNAESGLEIDKLEISMKELESFEEWTPQDMLNTSWIVEYKE